MGGLTWRSVRFGVGGIAGVVALGAAAGVVRLLPWLFSPEVPWQVTLPFARALFAAACEVGLAVGGPLGFALAAVVSVRRGDFRALSALGVSPERLAGSMAVASLAISVATAAVAGQGERGATAPGRFANALIREGARVCALGPRTSWIPLADVTWLCFPNGGARLVAPLPRSRGKLWFSAGALAFSDDLSGVVLDDLAVASRAASPSMRLQLRVGEARIRNLRAWGQPPITSPLARLVGMAVSASMLGIALAWIVFTRRVASLLKGGTLAVGCGFGLFRLVQALDHSTVSAWAYLALPLGMALGVALLQVVWSVAASGVTRPLRGSGGS